MSAFTSFVLFVISSTINFENIGVASSRSAVITIRILIKTATGCRGLDIFIIFTIFFIRCAHHITPRHKFDRIVA